MARIVETHMKPILTLVVQTVFKDDTISTVEYKDGDIVTNLRYVKDGDIQKVTGRVAKMNYKVIPTIRNYTEITKIKSNFASDVLVESIDLDASAVYNSNVIGIPAKEIVENENVLNVKRVKYFLKYGASFEVELSDDTTNKFELNEGQDIVGLTYLERGKLKTSNARLVAMKYDSNLIPTTLILIVDGRVKQIPSIVVKGIESTVSPIPAGSSINDAIKASSNGVVSVASGLYSENIVAEKDLTIYGAKAGIPATNLLARSGDDETIITGEIKVAAGSSITLDGVTLSNKALTQLKGVAGVTIKNCRVENLDVSANKTYGILTSVDDINTVVIKGCYFGNNPSEDDSKTMYNLIELCGTLKDGSEISNNYFAEKSSSHNDINIYKVSDDSHIIIKNNVWENSSNGIRIGIKGEPKCTIDIFDNVYYKTDEEYPEYAGLVCIQPYAKATTSMANIVINFNGNEYPDGPEDSQLYYLYAGAGDTQFTEYNVPTITVNGVVEMSPKVATI